VRDERNRKRGEEKWLAQQAMQRCCVCGRRFILRAEKICSRECLEKQEQQTKQQKAK
jgi:hypothetical protein